MQKIMFNDFYGLTQAVLEGQKTHTRRLIKKANIIARHWNPRFKPVHCYYKDFRGMCQLIDADSGKIIKPAYKIDEVVAVAQSYKNAGFRSDEIFYRSNPQIDGYIKETAGSQKGWNCKMYVAPGLMPHQIRITNVRVERLQDISDEDCLAEGVVVSESKIKGGVKAYYPCKHLEQSAKKSWLGRVFSSPRTAYAELINKISGEGIWERNPLVWVYEFELVK